MGQIILEIFLSCFHQFSSLRLCVLFVDCVVSAFGFQAKRDRGGYSCIIIAAQAQSPYRIALSF